MSITDTRNLGIEFERRIQTMFPQTELQYKLDTETIYSFLNEYQYKYVQVLYNTLNQGTENSSKIEHALEPLFTTIELIKNSDGTWVFGDQFPITFANTGNETIFDLNQNISLYIGSISEVSSSYNFKGQFDAQHPVKIVTNTLVSNKDYMKMYNTVYDSFRILRSPIITIDKNTVRMMHDMFTNVDKIKISYYKYPATFSILNSTACELPIESFDDIVTGAVQLYVTYLSGINNRKQEPKKDNNNEGN